MVLDPVSNQIRGGVWMGGYDDKTLLQMYKVEIEELRMRLVDMENRLKQQQQHAQSGEGSSSPSSTLASITEEISPQQVLDVNALISEKQAYMAKLQDEHLIKVALKERIDHLTKLILTSSTLTSKAAILDWDAPCSDGDSVFGDNEVGGDNASGVNIVVDTFGETVAKTGSVKRKSLRKRASVMTLQGLLLPSMTPSASNEDNKNDGVNTSPNSRIVHTSASSSPSSSTSRIPQSSLSPLRQQIHSMQISSSSQKQQQESEFYRRHIQEIDIRDEKISRLESLVAEISRTCSSTTTTITKTASVSSSSPISNILSLIRSFEESAGTSMDTIFTAHQAEVTRLNTDRAELEIIVKDQEETIVSMTSQIQEMNLMIEWHQQQQMQQQQLQKHNNPLGESATVMLMELDAQQARIRELEALNGGLQGQVVELKNLISSTSSSAATPSLTTPSSSNESSPFSSRPTSPTTTATQAIVSSSPPKRSLKSPGRTSSVRSTTSTTSLASSANLTLNSTTSTSTSGHLRRSSTASSASVRAIDKSLKQNFFDLFGGGSLLVNNNENQPEGDGDGDKRASALLWKG